MVCLHDALHRFLAKMLNVVNLASLGMIADCAQQRTLPDPHENHVRLVMGPCDMFLEERQAHSMRGRCRVVLAGSGRLSPSSLSGVGDEHLETLSWTACAILVASATHFKIM